MKMGVNLCGVELKNPVIAASGTFGFGREYDEFYDVGGLGGISVKGLTRLPRLGNPPHRITETPAGMLNSVGLQNPGVEAFLEKDLPWLLEKGAVGVANAAGSTEDDYCYMAERLSGTGIHILEMNISCPNVKEGGVAFGTRPESVYKITKAVRAHCTKPLMVKLSPNVADIAEVALRTLEAFLDTLKVYDEDRTFQVLDYWVTISEVTEEAPGRWLVRAWENLKYVGNFGWLGYSDGSDFFEHLGTDGSLDYMRIFQEGDSYRMVLGI